MFASVDFIIELIYSYRKASSASPALAENFEPPTSTSLVLSSTPTMLVKVEGLSSKY
nr:MAG TPA: hypothetical protein [Bacteriophage sp.]